MNNKAKFDIKPVWAASVVLAVVVSAYFMTLAISSSQYTMLSWITLLPLFLAIRIFTPVRSMLCGALWGSSLFVFSQSVETPVAATLSSFLMLTAIPAIYTFLGSRMTRRIGFSPLLLGLGWMGVEFALNPLGLHRGLLAASQGDGLFIHTIGTFTGYILIAFVVAYVNAMLLTVLTQLHSCLCGKRILMGSGSRIRNFNPFQFAYDLIDMVNQAQPRAPPVSS